MKNKSEIKLYDIFVEKKFLIRNLTDSLTLMKNVKLKEEIRRFLLISSICEYRKWSKPTKNFNFVECLEQWNETIYKPLKALIKVMFEAAFPTVWKVFLFGVFLVRIFPHSDQQNSEYGHLSCSVQFQYTQIVRDVWGILNQWSARERKEYL